jgi:cyclophilin family peptidyl-prolyl cis-trans isomerase/HEAT repeat protein
MLRANPSMIRLVCVALLAALSPPAAAQGTQLSPADSALIGRILLAEDRRDSTDRALTDGAHHADVRIRTIAQRALGRIRDPRFAARDSLPPLPAPPAYPDPAWRVRFRALVAPRQDCNALRTALTDSAWPVRLRAADLLAGPCTDDDAVAVTLLRWITALPADASHRNAGDVSWQGAAHAIVALARIRPNDARGHVGRLAKHKQWQVRMYTARAAGQLGDVATLRPLAKDGNDDVREAAISALSKLRAHVDDDIYLSALNSRGAQVVRAAAMALKGSSRGDVRPALFATFDKWVRQDNASAHDVRAALLDAAGRPATDDHPPAIKYALPPRAVALALGADIRVRVTMSPKHGGGSFVVRLRGDVAPMMAARILALANAHYYDGLSWHRVEHDFVIQGGSPGANEYVGLAQAMRDELGIVPHVRGTVGMSTRGHDTGDAQWFVNLRDNLRLNRDYTIFGEITEGIDVVDGILEGDVIASIAEIRSR